MKLELIEPATTVALAILARVTQPQERWTEAVIASAFEEAYLGLLQGIQRIEKQEPASHWESGRTGG